MNYIIFYLNSSNELLYVTIGSDNIQQIADAIKYKPWIKEVSEIYFAKLNNEKLAKLYLNYYIVNKKPKYNQLPSDAEKSIDLPDLELVKFNKNHYSDVNINSIVSLAITGGVVGSLLPGVGILIGIALGAALGGVRESLDKSKQSLSHILDILNNDEKVKQ